MSCQIDNEKMGKEIGGDDNLKNVMLQVSMTQRSTEGAERRHEGKGMKDV
jgi:hypothetical protein